MVNVKNVPENLYAHTAQIGVNSAFPSGGRGTALAVDEVLQYLKNKFKVEKQCIHTIDPS